MADSEDFIPPSTLALTARDSQAKLTPPVDYHEKPVPLLGISRFPGTLSTLGVQTVAAGGVPPRFEFPRACILIPDPNTLPDVGESFYDISIMPVDVPNRTVGNGLIYGLTAERGVCHIWAPGVWRISIDNGIPGTTVRFVVVPTEDPLVIERFTRPQWTGRQSSSPDDVNVPAAASTLLLSAADAMRSDYLRVENRGANPARIGWNPLSVSATRGFNLDPNAFLEFQGITFPTAALEGFSVLGTDISVYRVSRSFFLF